MFTEVNLMITAFKCFKMIKTKTPFKNSIFHQISQKQILLLEETLQKAI